MSQSKKLDDSYKSLLNQSIVTPVKVDQSIMKSSRKKMFQSRTNLDLGQFNDSKLSQLYQNFDDEIVNNGQGQIICLADIQNKQLVINPQAINLFKKYSKNELAFVGNCGKKGAGKSFWYDKILNLSQVQGTHYSNIQNNPGLYIWSIPFIKKNLRIFLIDFQNKREGEALSAQDEKLLDLELILSEVIVVLPEPDDQKLKTMDLAYNNLKSSMSRLSDNGETTQKETPYWPHSIYNLYRSTKPVSKQTDKLAYLFQDYTFSIIHNALNLKATKLNESLSNSSLKKGDRGSKILNDKYVKRTSLVFKDIYNKLKGKKYVNVTYNGKTAPFILTESASYLNKGKSCKMDKLFNDVKKDLYEQKFKYGTFVYDVKYDNLLKGNPRPLDNVLDQFRQTNQNVQNQFRKDKYDDILHQQYQKKLLDYGTNKQAQVLKYNRGETTKFLNQKLPRFQNQKQPNLQVIDYIQDLKKTNQQLDHDRVIPVKERLKGICQCAVKYKYFHVVHTEAYYNQRKKEMDLQNKRKELADLKHNKGSILLFNDGQGRQAEDLLNQHDRSLEKIDKTKSQLEVSKKINNAAISDQDLQKQLQNYKADLESTLRKNEKKLRDLQKGIQLDPKIVTLKQKLDDKAALQMQIQGGLSVFNQRSQSMLNGRRSQIRKVKKQQIKKSSVHKSMAK